MFPQKLEFHGQSFVFWSSDKSFLCAILSHSKLHLSFIILEGKKKVLSALLESPTGSER